MAANLTRPSDEDAQILEIARLFLAKVAGSAEEGGLFRRDAHPKHHGCVKAWFEVGADVPAALKHGIFAEPKTYAAWIRLSNGNPELRSDARRDQRGFAIKVMGVPGEKILAEEPHTQDFLLSSAPRFFIRNVADYVVLTRYAVKPPVIRILRFFFGWNPFNWRLHEFKALQDGLKKTTNLLATRYWSQTPYRLGPHVVKYSAIPASPDPGFGPSRAPNVLRERLATQLRAGEATFDFAVQVQTDPVTMPIEDATIEWPEASAPFQKVATIRIPRQEFQSPEQMALAEHIALTPWHALPAHEPLGPMNRTRRVVYEMVSSLRRRLNGVPPFEPTSHDDLGKT